MAELQYLLYQQVDPDTLLTPEQPWYVNAAVARGPRYFYDLQMSAGNVDRLLASQRVLAESAPAPIVVLPADQEAPERLEYAKLRELAFVPTEAWPGRVGDLACSVCHLPIGKQPTLEDKDSGEPRHAFPDRCQEARDDAEGAYFMTTAGPDYDGFGTHTVELLPYRTKRGSQYRLVWIPMEHQQWQIMRNASGGALTMQDSDKQRADTESLAEHGLLERVAPTATEEGSTAQ